MATSSESERMAAYDIQVELVTRVGVQELDSGTGSLREALTSLKSLLDFTRATLRAYGTSVTRAAAGQPTVPGLCDALVNDVIGPFTTAWHPRLTAHEACRPGGTAPLDHEASWPEAAAMRTELTALREPLLHIEEQLSAISGADFGAPATG
ncbi:hypothetical protein ACIPSE_19055 [Streptomyces sp. NPDC090106]|uniref:hypothetical protein n=1 Tax=Streptomyces sp. NPDC090106 TaxID=3365946 RepID=UPI00382899B8